MLFIVYHLFWLGSETKIIIIEKIKTKMLGQKCILNYLNIFLDLKGRGSLRILYSSILYFLC